MGFVVAPGGPAEAEGHQLGPGLDAQAAGVPTLNTNYYNTYVSQNSLLLTTIANEVAAKHTISAVTIQLGGNDLYAMAGTPGFFGLSAAQQQALVVQALGVIQMNDTALLSELHKLVPSAQLIMMGNYDPYAPFRNDPTSPYHALAQASAVAIPALNQVIAGEAAAFGGVYVDEYTPFVGHELAYTYTGEGTNNIHPNAAGYAAITAQLTAATVPEPGSLGLTLFGGVGVGLLGLARRRRRTVVVRGTRPTQP